GERRRGIPEHEVAPSDAELDPTVQNHVVEFRSVPGDGDVYLQRLIVAAVLKIENVASQKRCFERPLPIADALETPLRRFKEPAGFVEPLQPDQTVGDPDRAIPDTERVVGATGACQNGLRVVQSLQRGRAVFPSAAFIYADDLV